MFLLVSGIESLENCLEGFSRKTEKDYLGEGVEFSWELAKNNNHFCLFFDFTSGVIQLAVGLSDLCRKACHIFKLDVNHVLET